MQSIDASVCQPVYKSDWRERERRQASHFAFLSLFLKSNGRNNLFHRIKSEDGCETVL